MTPTEQAWLENRMAAAVADDFYLDRGEEKGIKEEAAARGYAVADTELTLRNMLDKYGAVSERQLLDTLDYWLHQSTDDDKVLDYTEERNTLDRVLIPATGKKCGLNETVAEEKVASFCKVNGIERSSGNLFKRTKGQNKVALALVAAVAVVIVGVGVVLFNMSKSAEVKVETREVVRAGSPSAAIKLTDIDRAEIDDQYRRAVAYVSASQFTDPPEKSAKACIDTIKRIDPNGSYRGDEVKGLIVQIVNQYMGLAERAFAQKDSASARKWVDRAKLFYAESEVIRDKERALGIVAASEQK
jgi:hypothetical protein